MKCSLRSSRYVYDGECVSRKPVVETVCADRCIRYEYVKAKSPFFLGQSRDDALMTPGEMRKKVSYAAVSESSNPKIGMIFAFEFQNLFVKILRKLVKQISNL